MRRFIRYILTLNGLIVVTLVGLLLLSRRHPSNAYWLLVSQDEGSQQQLAKMSPAGGRLFPITPKWRAFRELEALADDEWLYLAHYPGQYDADGRERAELIRVHRADLHYELFGWLSVSETLTPMPDGDWLVTNVSYQTTGFYRLRRDGTGRQLIFRFDDPNLAIPTFPGVQFSPDGQWLYFNATDSGLAQFGVYRVRLDGTEVTHLSPRAEHYLALMNWPPTDEWVFVERGARDRHIYRVGVGGADFGPLISDPALSDEEWVATLSDLMILRNRQNGQLLAIHSRTFDPMWRITDFVQDIEQLPSGEVVIATTQGITRLNPTGSHTLITPFNNLGPFYFFHPTPSAWVYFHTQAVNGDYSESVKRLNPQTGQTDALVTGLHGFDLGGFAPDGTWLVFRGIIDSKPGLYRVNADGSGLYRITDNYADPLVVDFGPAINRTWSAALLVTIGVVLLVVGVRRSPTSPPSPLSTSSVGEAKRPYSSPSSFTGRGGGGVKFGFLRYRLRLPRLPKNHTTTDTP